MRRCFALLLCCMLVLPLLVACEPQGAEDAKPVIYLYPETVTDVEVKLHYSGELTCAYPAYRDGWRVTAHPDGTLIDRETGAEYAYLFWEGRSQMAVDWSRGFCVRGEDTAGFLEQTLTALGLNAKERNEFIVYWLPLMQENPYNLITFQTSAYTEVAELEITPTPDSMLRVFMVFRALKEPIEIESPDLTPFVREGFTVVEWGGRQEK